MQKFDVHVFQFMDSRGGTVVSRAASKEEAIKNVLKENTGVCPQALVGACWAPMLDHLPDERVDEEYAGMTTIYLPNSVHVEVKKDLGEYVDFYASKKDHMAMTGDDTDPLYFVDKLIIFGYLSGNKPLDPDLQPIRLDDDGWVLFFVD